MTCDRVAPLLAAAADGTLDADRRGILDAHLTACAACREALGDQLAVRAWLARTPDAVVPAGFGERVRARIEDDGLLGLVDFRIWTLRLAPLAALLAVVAWLGVGAATSSTSGSPTPVATTSSAVFTPSLAADWQRSVSGNALLEAALRPPHTGGSDVR